MDDAQLEVNIATEASASGTADSAELGRLGLRLIERSADVSQLSELLNRDSRIQLDATAHARVARVTAVSTEAIARWLSGDGPDGARDVGREAAQIFGQLAIQRAAPMNELTKRALRWRDATGSVLGEIAAAEGVSDGALTEALARVQRSLDVTLVRLGEAFEDERGLVDEELANRQQELVFLATHDPLTGLPNRTLILDRTEQLIARSRRENQLCGALFIDLDGFKAVNDGLGHRAGDELLRAVAERLENTIRDADTLGRLGGDEFVILVEGVALAAGAELVAERILDALSQPFAIVSSPASSPEVDVEVEGAHSGKVTISASIGIALGERESATDLLRDADIAMYRAKLEGRSRYMVFQTGMQDAIHQRIELEMDLREAMDNKGFYLVYQPMFELGGLAPVRMEALLRWRRPDHQTVSPEMFVPLLEQSGMISEVGRWVLEEACRCCASWARDGIDIGVAVNVSAVQLDTDRFVDDVIAALKESGLRPSALTIEITETALMRDADQTAKRLRVIKALGVRLSIDDFGTGYSSLAYLQRFPVDELKIDRSFISQIEGTSRDALIRTFVQLGHSLDIETIAEGIEDRSQLEQLQAERCDIGQGFLFARPMEADECRRFLEDSSATATVRPSLA